jgi:AraC-like DNA-binding protein
MAEPNYPGANRQEAARGSGGNGLQFGIIPRWVNGLDLAGGQFRVLSVIACHARKETRIARPSIETIADEANLDRRTVQRAISQLEAKGVLKRLPGGGRGRSSEYQIIFELAADTANNNSGNHAAVSDAGDTANSGVFVPQTAAFSSLNSGTDAAPTDSEQRERYRLPFGGAARACACEGGRFFR